MHNIHGMARWFASALAVCLVVPMMPLSQAWADETYTRPARGFIDIAPDGTIEALELESDLDGAGPAYESLMRQWRFNPIMTTAGEPVGRTVRVSMSVDLYARRQEDGTYSLSTDRPQFLPVEDPGHVQRRVGLEHMPVPRFPAQATQEARVLLLVEIGADGSVTRVGTRSAAVLNHPMSREGGRQLRRFVGAAHKAAQGMRFVPSDEETRRVMVPYEFLFHGTDENAWKRIVFVPRAQDAWVESALAGPDADVEDLDVNGRPRGSSIALATEIAEPWL